MNDIPVAEKLEVVIAKRRQAWKDLADSEKIERMHDVVKQQGREIDRYRAELSRLRSHRHADNGDLLIPIHFSDSGNMPESQANPEGGPWF